MAQQRECVLPLTLTQDELSAYAMVRATAGPGLARRITDPDDNLDLEDPAPSKAFAGPAGAGGAESRTRPHLSMLIAAQFLVYQPLRHVVPGALIRFLLAPGLLYLGWKLLHFKRWADEHKYIPRFVLCLSTLILQLLLEWEIIWLASASDHRKYESVPGLQDNVQQLLSAVAVSSPAAKSLIFWKWLDTLPFLLAFLATALSPLWHQVPYSGFGMASRMTLTMALSRLIRCLCFSVTLLPSPRPGCYKRKYPHLPENIWDVLLLPWRRKLQLSGGCNDLIFSGHCGAWTLTPLVLQTYYPGHRGCLVALWFGLLQTAARDVAEHYHYSVDMVLGVVCTWAVWTWLEPVYPRTAMVPLRPQGMPADKMHPAVLLLVAFALGFGLYLVLGLGG